MASINGVGSSNMRSIYGNRNVISGLASGMDTESMIENAVSGYKMKITSLQQKQTKVTWQQQALRSIIDKLADFSQKYTSYASSTNLLSSSFFNNSLKISAQGTYADKVSATGKTSSTVQILGVKQLASAATHNIPANWADGSIDLSALTSEQMKETTTISNLTGSLTIANGNSDSVTIDLTEEDMAGVDTMEKLAAKINKKLEEAGYKEKGENKGKIWVECTGDTINLKGNNATYIKSASGKIRDTLGIQPGEDAKALSKAAGKELSTEITRAEQLDGKEISVTLDGVTKKFTLKTLDDQNQPLDHQKVMEKLGEDLQTAFGKNKVTLQQNGDVWELKAAEGGSTLSVSSSVGKLLGLESNHETSYMNMNKTLGDLIGEDTLKNKDYWIKAEGKVTEKDGKYLDEKGNLVKKADDGTYYRVDDKGEYLCDFKVNGESVGTFTKDSTLESVMSAINKSTKAGVDVTYSKITNEFQFTSRETGSQAKIELDGLAAELFGKVETQGKDAVFSMSVNGKEFKDISRSGNTFDVDGLQVSLKGTFNYATSVEDLKKAHEVGGKQLYEAPETMTLSSGGKPVEAKYLDSEGYYVDENGVRCVGSDDAHVSGLGVLGANAGKDAVSFTSAADSDKIVDALKKFAEDYNAMVKEIKDTYSTLPLQKSNGSSYEPLTSDDLEGMSETEIKNYEEKAKQGLLFGDRDLSNLYNQLTSSITSNTDLKKIGIEVSYSNGMSTLTVNEEKLRAALDSDPEQVQEVFNSATGNGKTMMESMKSTLDRYGSVMGKKGILVDRAGSTKASSTLLTNTMQKTIDNYESQIQKWKDKMTDQVDRYTRQFSQLEQLIAQMNAQSSSLSGLMGGF